ncbi:MAG: hypothetical protein KAU35_04310 [candidate division Zixibacteria bacterium]|nr:hypothetical protein [candidate division Zixibacteria bacterium]
MQSYRKSLLLFAAFLLIFLAIVAYAADLRRPYWHDERSFVETIRHFGEGINLDTILHYEQPSTPLSFILYSFWGRLVGFEIHHLRLFSLLVALTTFLLAHRWLFAVFENGRLAFWAAVFLVAHPYMIGLSLFVYTDMLAIGFLIASCLAIHRSSPMFLWVSVSCALLCRQYSAFFWLAALVFYLLRWRANLHDNSRSMFAAVVFSALPMLALFLLWGGPSPDNSNRYLYVDEGIAFHPNFLILYVALLFVYLLPLCLLRLRELYGDARTIVIALVASGLYWVFPVRPSPYVAEQGIDVVGFFHRFLRLMFGDSVLVHVVFSVAFCFGVPIVWYCARDSYQKIRKAQFDLPLFLNLSILAFLVIMPFSYQEWEKYLMPLVPLATARILLLGYSGNRATG